MGIVVGKKLTKPWQGLGIFSLEISFRYFPNNFTTTTLGKDAAS
jgi:hypothetical protein